MSVTSVLRIMLDLALSIAMGILACCNFIWSIWPIR
jgi:hypothetical protein